MKLGILGGSFNPFHNGHLYLADTALTNLNLDRIIFVPANRSPFKVDAKEDCCAIDRLDMIAAAIEGDLRFALDNCEIKREGVSYTVDTLEDIIERYMPSEKPVLIIGDDCAEDFPKWHKSEKILQLADVAIACRLDSIQKDFSYPHIKIKNDVMNISSQSIRQKIAADSAWRSLVPPGTRALIEDRQLYGIKNDKISENCSLSLIQRIECFGREVLSHERFLHSRNTALHASDMCRRFGLDPLAGYLAGIAHDLAKQLDNKQLIKIVKDDGQEVSALEKDKPNLLHGKAAAVLLRERFCIHNNDVLEAVAFHTSGSENMGQLAKVIYIADKTEFSRNIDPAVRKMCMTEDLDSILYTVLEKTIVKLKSRELDLSEDTLKLLERIKERTN